MKDKPISDEELKIKDDFKNSLGMNAFSVICANHMLSRLVTSETVLSIESFLGLRESVLKTILTRYLTNDLKDMDKLLEALEQIEKEQVDLITWAKGQGEKMKEADTLPQETKH